jgi:transposase
MRRGRQPRRVGDNFLLRLSTRKQDVLRFLSSPVVLFTINEAERDGRMMKLRQKIPGGFRSEDSVTDFRLLSTAKKQGRNLLHTLIANQDSLIDDLTCSLIQPHGTWAATQILPM